MPPGPPAAPSALRSRALRVIFSATICSSFDLEEFHRFAKAGIHTLFEGLQTSSRISAQNRFELRSESPTKTEKPWFAALT